MNLLALETATESCSAALSTDNGVTAHSQIAPRRHAELLLPMCEELLSAAGLVRRDLDALAVGCGPGAFTGVRLAISAAQGIAFALGIPVVPVSSLAALALQAPDNGAPILAVIDARMGEIYAGTFRRTREGGLDAITPASVGPAQALELPEAAAWNVIGSGWTVARELLLAKLHALPLWAEGDRYPQATDVARLALPMARAGRGIAAEHLAPVYLRDKVALTLADQRLAAAARRDDGSTASPR